MVMVGVPPYPPVLGAPAPAAGGNGGNGGSQSVAVKALWGPAALGIWAQDYTDPDFDLDDADNSLGFTFMCPKDGVINRVGFTVKVFNGAPPNYNVGLVTLDAAGDPTTTPAGGSAIVSYAPTGTGIITVALTTPATVNAGDIVAVRVWPGVTPPSGVNSIDLLNAANFASDGHFPYRNLYSASWTKTGGYPALFAQYDDDEIVGIKASTFAGPVFDVADTPDEAGSRFTLPAAMTCFGCRVGFNRIGDSGSFEVRLYAADDTLLATATVSDTDHINQQGSASGEGACDFFWDAVALAANTVYRLTVRATHATITQQPAIITAGDANAKGFLPEGANWQETERTDLGAWTDTELELPVMALWVSAMTLPV